MRRIVSPSLLRLTLCFIVICALGCGLISTAHAGLRGLGKYSGVVIFDRWDTCFLLSGHFIVTYEIDPYSRITERFELRPGQSQRIRVLLKLPPGEYQFLIGYGGGVHESRSLASNAISFDIHDTGQAVVAR